jgi:hypothetical protein
LAAAGELANDGFDGGGPDKGSGLLIPGSEELVNGRDQVLDAQERIAAEPGENRWIIEWGSMKSYSGRFSVFPSKNWILQVSAGRLTRPERQEPGDVVRTTASLEYTRPMEAGNAWSTSLIWGRNHDTFTQHNLNSFLVETVYPIGRKNFLTGRLEHVDKDELFADTPALEERL